MIGVAVAVLVVAFVILRSRTDSNFNEFVATKKPFFDAFHFSNPAYKSEPEPESMHPNGDYSSLDGTQDVYARGHVIEKAVQAPVGLTLYEEPVSNPPYYSSLKHVDGSPYEVIDTVMNAGQEVHGDYTTLDGSQEVYARSTVVPNSAVRSDTTDYEVLGPLPTDVAVSLTHGRFLPVICHVLQFVFQIVLCCIPFFSNFLC